MPPRRVFGPGDSALDVDEDGAETQPGASLSARRPSGRVSFSRLVHKPSILSRWSRTGDEESGATETPERPSIPSALQPPGEVYATPLPVLSMIVLSIVRPFLQSLCACACGTERCAFRQCSANSSPPTYPLPSCSSWWKVCLIECRYYLQTLSALQVSINFTTSRKWAIGLGY